MTALLFPQTSVQAGLVCPFPSLQSSIFEPMDTATATTAASQGAAAEQGPLCPLLHKQTKWVAGFYSQLIQAIGLSRNEIGASMAMNVSKLAIDHGFLKWALFQGIQSSWHWKSMYMASNKCAHT